MIILIIKNIISHSQTRELNLKRIQFMTIYNISIITSTGFPYFHKKLKNLPDGIKLYQRFFDFTEERYRDHDLLDPTSSFELNAGLVSALFEFAKNIDKKILTLEFKSISQSNNLQKGSQGAKKYTGDALITMQTETYLLHKSIKQKINLIYNSIISSKIPLETAYSISNEEEQKIAEILTDLKAKNHVLKNQSKLEQLTDSLINEMGRYGLYNVVITSFDLSPLIVLGNKFSLEDIEGILRNLGEIPDIDPMEWKFRQSFYKDSQIWVYIINSGVGVTVEDVFQPYFYLLFAAPESYFGDFPAKLMAKFNGLIG